VPDTFSSNYNLILMATGGDSGTWGSNLNSSAISPLDTILGGTQSIVMSNANVTLSLAQWQNKAFRITGTLTANLQLILPLSPNAIGGTPAVGGEFIVDNRTTGAFTLTVLTAATGSTGVGVVQGVRISLYSDTVNVLYTNTIAAPGSVLNVSLATAPAWTLKGNNTSGSAAPQDFTIDALTVKATPLAADEVPIWDAAGAAMKKATLSSIGSAIPNPTVQRFTSGSGTYTPTVGTVRIRARMCGGGGGGGGPPGTSGTNGGNSSFGGWVTNAGQGSGPGGTGGANGTGTLILRLNGVAGGAGSATFPTGGGSGGNTPFGGGGSGGAVNTSGTSAAANTGSGGGGGGAGGNSSGNGGGAGEYVEFWMTAGQIGASQSYVVGTAGAHSSNGGDGAAGQIIVEEYYI
jgi:hypothetical protein